MINCIKGKLKSDLVARTDCPRPLRIEDARLADYLPVELRKTPDKRQPESAAAQREEPWSERNTREIQQREVDSKKRQVGIQPSGTDRREADTAVSSQGESKACFAALAERKTRFYIAVKIPGRKVETMGNAMEKRYCCCTVCLPSQLVKTITCARGTEFANWLQIEERLHCEVYFADPCCAWQKGAIENLNGLLREFYPRGKNLSRVAPPH